MTPTTTYPKGTTSKLSLNGWIIAFFVLFASTTAFASDRLAPDFKGMENFRKAYPNATNISVDQKKEYTIVTFTWNEMQLQAFYDIYGHNIATTRQIPVNNLPLSYLMNIRNDYPGYVPVEAIELDHNTDGLSYYVTVISKQKTYVLQISSEGNISVFKKMKH